MRFCFSACKEHYPCEFGMGTPVPRLNPLHGTHFLVTNDRRKKGQFSVPFSEAAHERSCWLEEQDPFHMYHSIDTRPL